MKTKPILRLVMLSSLFLLFAPCDPAAAQEKPVQAWSARQHGAEYRIGAGDILEISTWKEPDLSRREVLVRVDGKISFPLIGDLQAAGLTPVELTEAIQKGLKEYVASPVVTVTVINPASQRIYVLGEVQRTGEYPIGKNLTVLQAFALAGGFTQWAAKDEIILLRREGGRERIYKINYKDIVRGRDVETNIMLQANDTIVVP